VKLLLLLPACLPAVVGKQKMYYFMSGTFGSGNDKVLQTIFLLLVACGRVLRVTTTRSKQFTNSKRLAKVTR